MERKKINSMFVCKQISFINLKKKKKKKSNQIFSPVFTIYFSKLKRTFFECSGLPYNIHFV